MAEMAKKAGRGPAGRETLGAGALRLLSALAAAGAAALYFRSFALILAGAALVYRMIVPLILKQREGRARTRLRRDMILWLEELSMGLKAGKSLATATRDLAARLTAGAAGGRGDRAAEGWRRCLGMIHLHYPIGQVYRELAGRLALPEMLALASLIGSAVKTGANLPYVFIRSATGMREQLESREALESALAARRLEGYLLAAAPALYTACLRLATPAYMAPLYSGGGRYIAMAVFGLQLAGCRMFFHLLIREGEDPPELVLAGFQEELALQLQAGLSLPEAWQQAAGSMADGGAAGSGGKGEAGLAGSLAHVAGQAAVGTPFGKALECLLTEKGGAPGLRRLAELIRQNYQSGGGALSELLSLEAKEARQRCLLDRQAGDAKRGTLLLFPMVLLLLSALVLTAAPALMSI